MGVTSVLLFLLFMSLILLINATSTVPTDPLAFNSESQPNVFSNATPTTSGNRPPLDCSFAPGLRAGDRERELECCARMVDRYHLSWLFVARPLSRYLATLKGWNCPQFQQECKQRLFVFNTFTELLYDYICDNSTYFDKCLPKLTEKFTPMSSDITIEGSASNTAIVNDYSQAVFINQWQKILAQIQPAQMTIEELLEPCVQIAQYAQTDGNETYQEILSSNFGIPSCEIAWCGFGAQAIRAHDISIRTCLKSSCQTSVIMVMVVCGLLGFAIAVVNILIIVVFCLRPHGQKPLLKNSQAVYKMSLAVADLLVGVVVLPTCVANMYKYYWIRHLPRDELRRVEGYEVINGTLSENVTVIQKEFLAGTFAEKFPQSYINFAGFFTGLSLFVSVYMLTGAGFDRLNAVAKPFAYKKVSALAESTRFCIAFWIIAFILGLLPVFVQELQYVLFNSLLFVSSDFYGLILYAILFVIPLVIVWVVNLLTYYHSIKHANFRRSLTQTALKKRQRVERRLASTLRLMVGVFTFNTLPLIITLICPLFIPSIVPSTPTNFNAKSAIAFHTASFVAIILLLGNSLCNFFIYSARNHEFRRSLKSLFIKIGKATKLSVCLRSTTLCFRDIARRSSNVSIPLSALSFSRQRRSTAATIISKLDETCTHNGHTDSSDVFTISISSRTNTPNLSGQRRNRHDGVATNDGSGAPRKSKTFSATLESLNEDSIFGTPVLEHKPNDRSNSVIEHSTDDSKSENDSL